MDQLDPVVLEVRMDPSHPWYRLILEILLIRMDLLGPKDQRNQWHLLHLFLLDLMVQQSP